MKNLERLRDLADAVETATMRHIRSADIARRAYWAVELIEVYCHWLKGEDLGDCIEEFWAGRPRCFEIRAVELQDECRFAAKYAARTKRGKNILQAAALAALAVLQNIQNSDQVNATLEQAENLLEERKENP